MKEFQYSNENFQYLKKKVKQLAGIHLTDSKDELVYSRLSRLLRQYHIDSFDEYCQWLEQKDPQIEADLINAIATNFTTFMRESHHFEYLYNVMLPEIYKRNISSKKIRIWSAGCSTGEEAYSISFLLRDFFRDKQHWDIKILATDIDTEALNTAELGCYARDIVAQIPKCYLDNIHRYFNDNDTFFEVKKEYKDIVYYKNFNLMTEHKWPMHGPFDIIFCRNVLIYFDRQSQNHIINNFLNLLSISSFLVLGHSETVSSALQRQFKYLDKTIYRRIQ